ncbi:MAG: hypothetical protein ACK5L3_14895 [Oscillospiraceae bacterium]
MGSLIWGIIMLIGGLSGKLVLRGTNSSAALVVVGCILIIIGIVRLVRRGRAQAQSSSYTAQGQGLPPVPPVPDANGQPLQQPGSFSGVETGFGAAQQAGQWNGAQAAPSAENSGNGQGTNPPL